MRRPPTGPPRQTELSGTLGDVVLRTLPAEQRRCLVQRRAALGRRSQFVVVRLRPDFAIIDIFVSRVAELGFAGLIGAETRHRINIEPYRCDGETHGRDGGATSLGGAAPLVPRLPLHRAIIATQSWVVCGFFEKGLNMARVLMIAVALSLTAIVPANAQSGSCSDWCRANRCGAGMTSGAAPRCMTQCMSVCQQKMKGKK
jgi:hypothetical protein